MKYWNSTRDKTESKRPVDGVILPVAPSAAVEEGLFSYFGQFSSRRPTFPRVFDYKWRVTAYSAIANMLDYTAGSFPVTFASRSLDIKQSEYEPHNLTDRAVWQSCENHMNTSIFIRLS